MPSGHLLSYQQKCSPGIIMPVKIEVFAEFPGKPYYLNKSPWQKVMNKYNFILNLEVLIKMNRNNVRV
jgi:hypothetical protein